MTDTVDAAFGILEGSMIAPTGRMVSEALPMSESSPLPRPVRQVAMNTGWRRVLVMAILAMAPALGCTRPTARAPVEGGSAANAPPAMTAAAEQSAPYAGPVWFTDVSAASGIDFVHRSGDSPDKPFPSANGSGQGAIDYDLDGRYDLVFVRGVPFPIDDAAGDDSARLFRNLGGLRFADVTMACGLRYGGYGHGVAVGDHDADGFPDLFVTGYGGDVLFHNRGDGTFEANGPAAGFADGRWSSSAAFVDADGDGLLDLYVCRYGKWTPETSPYCGDRLAGRRVFCSPLTVEPEPDVLRHNNGDGTFSDVTAAAGIDGRPGRALGVIAADVDGDGCVDLYVANDMNPNSLWLGDGRGRFRDSSDLSGTAYDHEGRVKSSMGVDIADTGNRGQIDIMVTDFQGEENLFFAGSPDGIFRDVAETSGAGSPSLPYVSWGIQFADFDLDGWDDALITNGHVGDDRHKTGDSAVLQQLPLFLHNDQGRFREPPREELGPYFQAKHQGRGVTAVDLDNDGDQDVAFNHRDEPASLLRNDHERARQPTRSSTVLRLVGTAGNRDCVGAVVTMSVDGQTRIAHVKGGGGYQSSRDQRVSFALPAEGPAPSFSIRWPGGRITPLPPIGVGGQWLVIEPSSPDASPVVFREAPPP